MYFIHYYISLLKPRISADESSSKIINTTQSFHRKNKTQKTRERRRDLHVREEELARGRKKEAK